MAQIEYQSYNISSDTVGEGAFSVDGDVTLSQAQRLAEQDAGAELSVDLVAVVNPDGTDLVARWETDHAEEL
ncbi:hypothetical protein [Actinoplanes aureus]|uniref:Uncharacterized protein n=1 Tax=Actinoplanes aureus TaxID=2792083 RepID=A0A931G292_9ACTN|nr:hypothetical protein [Actinoplanes aureus]MBG0568798.1 hypothetical protein [Actinoplanes aureus]